MKSNFFWILFIFALIIFRGIFVGSIYWGDSPHFFPEEVSQFQSESLVWTSLGNNFGGLNLPLWLSPFMFLWRWFPPQILFIIPSIVLSLIGPILLTRYLKLGKLTQFFSSAIYTFNTYFLLLVDGGQLGVALSYGIFPFTALYLKKLVDDPKFKNFYPALTLLTLNGLADPRIALVAVVTIVVWNITKIRNLLSFIPLGISWLLLNAFWIMPFIKNKSSISFLGQVDIARVKFIDPLLLFSPHWPDNLFGKFNTPPFYFFGIPLLIFLGVYISKRAKVWTYLLVYLFFGILSTIPIGVIFRDSTKFYIPVILFAGILIGQTVESFKKTWFGVLVFSYILFLISPAILGKMNFVLSNRDHGGDFTKIYENLKTESGFYRTTWFPERHPLTFETENSPALDAKELVKLLPFATINAGEDPFNFINSGSFVDNFKTLGIKYLIFSGNPREISKTPDEARNWDRLTALIGKTKGLEKVDWGVELSVYKIPGSYPHLFSVKTVVGVIGPPISMKFPSVNFEDGRFDGKMLKDVDPGSLVFYFNGKTPNDFMMSFLSEHFVFPKDAASSQWATYSHDQYLKYKYQLLTRNVDFEDLDYGGGIAFSTIPGEQIVFKFDIPKDGKYLVAIRSMDKDKGETGLSWKIDKPQDLRKGVFTYTITNNSKLEIVNAAALVSESDMNGAKINTTNYMSRFKIINESNLSKFITYKNINLRRSETLKYELSPDEGDFWIIFTDNYSDKWQARSKNESLIHLPIYSMVNGYYTEGKNSDIEISFLGQKYLNLGIYISVASLATLIVVVLAHEKFFKRGSRN